MITIVIPVYNVKNYLCECIDSVLNQKFHDYEIILVDDGSTDGSGKLCDDYKMNNSKITVIHQKNAGLSEARNAGLKIAKGDYVYFLDSDDYIRNDALEVMNEEIVKANPDLIYFEASVFYDSMKSDSTNLIVYDRKKEYDIMTGGQISLKLFRENEYYTAVPLHLFKREFLLENKLFFYPGILHEDNLFTTLAFIKAKKAKHIHAKLYYRRMRRGSIMTTEFTNKNFHGYCTCIIELINEIDKYRNDSYERIFLKEFITKRCYMVLNIHHKLSKEKRNEMKTDYDLLKNKMKGINFFNNIKLRFLFEHIGLSNLYLKLKN